MRITIIIIIIKNTKLNREKGKPTLNKRMSEERLRTRDEFIIQTNKCMTCTRCPRRNGQNFERVFLRLNYTDITQNIYIQS